MRPRILIADDEPTIRKLLKLEFERAAFLVDLANDGNMALTLLQNVRYDAAVLDISMPVCDGLQVLRAIRQQGLPMIVVMMTAYGSIDGAVTAMKMQADDYITKPFDPPDLVEKVEQIRRVRQRMAQLGRPHAVQTPTLIGKSAAIVQIRTTVEKIRNRNTTVLITGESGTGKGVVAKYLHLTSDRRSLPFTHIDCASLPHNLIESELFGYEKGAFTGATAQKKGKLELAGQGTLFLDEIGTLSPELQAKLLVALQERRFTRLGGTQDIPIEARIVAATNENLEQSVADGTFRADLYYRLSIVCIECPPLRNHREDIPELASTFIRSHMEKTGVALERVDDDIFDVLMAYDWPGNVRELENTLESAVVLSDGRHLHASDLPKKITSCAGGHSACASPLSLENQEIMAILAALEKHGGHREHTAQELGISRRSLQYKLAKYHLNK